MQKILLNTSNITNVEFMLNKRPELEIKLISLQKYSQHENLVLFIDQY